jgi:Resolvase, N terminal domain
MGALGTRATTHVRVSTEEHVDSTSPGVQRESCRRVVEQRGWDLIGTFSDEGVSGTLGKPARLRPSAM